MFNWSYVSLCFQTRSTDPFSYMERGRLACGGDVCMGLEPFFGDFRGSCSPAEGLGRTSIGPLSESDEEEEREEEDPEERDGGQTSVCRKGLYWTRYQPHWGELKVIWGRSSFPPHLHRQHSALSAPPATLHWQASQEPCCPHTRRAGIDAHYEDMPTTIICRQSQTLTHQHCTFQNELLRHSEGCKYFKKEFYVYRTSS